MKLTFNSDTYAINGKWLPVLVTTDIYGHTTRKKLPLCDTEDEALEALVEAERQALQRQRYYQMSYNLLDCLFEHL